MSNKPVYAIQIKYLGNPDLLAGEVTTTYLKDIGPIPGTNYGHLFVNGGKNNVLTTKPFMFQSKENALTTCSQLQVQLNACAVAINAFIKKSPHALYMQFMAKVVPWNEEMFLADHEEYLALQDKQAVLKRIKERQLFRSRMRDKPIVDDLNDYT